MLATHDVLHPHETMRLVEMIQELKDVYVRHIEVEERDIFPLARTLLSSEDLQLIGNEIAARRNLRIHDFSDPGVASRDNRTI